MNRFYLRWSGIAVDPSEYGVALTAAEARQPLAAYYKRSVTPPVETLNGLNGVAPEHALMYAQKEMAVTHAAQLPNGYRLFADRTGYVHVRTECGGLTAAQLAWWLSWMGQHTLRYKTAYPGFHAFAEAGGRALRLKPGELCAFRCVTSIGAEPDGTRNAPRMMTVRWSLPETKDGYVCFRAEVQAGSFTAARLIVVLAEGALHCFAWLGTEMPSWTRGFVTEKKLYDMARYCAFLGVRTAAIAGELYAAQDV